MTDYTWSTDYDYSYIKTQIESGNAILKRATISVMVDENSLTDNRINELKALIFGCTDIPVELISVSAFDKTALNGPGDNTETTPADETPDTFIGRILSMQPRALILVGIGFLLLVMAIVAVIIVLKRKKKAKLAAEAEAEERAREEEALRKQTEIEDYKRTLEDIAKGKIDPKGEAIMEEVREFARTNPQIAANLIRSWLKEN
jgi:flagellar biosynthesis/type III secretory pathway M-ring protein FliF/YscJ